MGYIMHAGQAQEPVPIRRGALNLYGQKGWYDFFATRASLVRLLPIQPRSRGARRSLRTFPVVTLHPRFPFNV
jgi:hypothetical protein